MTYEQAQLYIRIFILQHYDENIEDILPVGVTGGRVFELRADSSGDWCTYRDFLFFASLNVINVRGTIMLNIWKKEGSGYMDIDILDYITLEEET